MKSPVTSATLLLASWQCWPLRSARFGPVDDHRFALFRGGRIEILVDGVQNAGVALSNLGRTPVFRPLIAIESGLAGAIFGVTPSGVFAYVFLKYLVTLTLIGVLSRQLVALLTAPRSISTWVREGIVLSIVVAAASIDAWQGIVPRTGPSESLLAIGLLLAAISALRISVSENPNIVYAFLLFAGVVICAGAKESGIASIVFLVLAARPLVVLSAGSRVRKGGMIFATLICALFPIHATLFVVSGQPDLYGTERNLSVVIRSLGERLSSPMLLVLILAVLVIASSVPRASEHRRLVITFVSALILLWIMDGAIYELNSPNLRYRMVYQIIEVLIVAAALAAGLISNIRTPRQSLLMFIVFCFALNVISVPIRGSQTLRDVSQATAEVTSAYWSSVEALATKIRREQRPTVLFSFDAAADYEPIVALGTYLRYLKVDLPISVFNAEPANEVWNSPEWLSVQGMQIEGRPPQLSPLDVVPSQGWICVGFSFSLDNPSQPLYELVNEKCAVIERI